MSINTIGYLDPKVGLAIGRTAAAIRDKISTTQSKRPSAETVSAHERRNIAIVRSGQAAAGMLDTPQRCTIFAGSGEKWEPPVAPCWLQLEGAWNPTPITSSLTTATARKALYAPATALARGGPRVPKQTHTVSIRHVATDYGIKSKRRMHPTFEETCRIVEGEDVVVEELIRGREYIRYHDYVHDIRHNVGDDASSMSTTTL